MYDSYTIYSTDAEVLGVFCQDCGNSATPFGDEYGVWTDRKYRSKDTMCDDCGTEIPGKNNKAANRAEAAAW
jgi:hypothetical protein